MCTFNATQTTNHAAGLWFKQSIHASAFSVFQVSSHLDVKICAAFWEMHVEPCLCCVPLRDSSRVTKGYFSSGASAFWAMSSALSITSVISTAVSSTFSAVIRSSGTDSAKPHLPPAFLASVKRKTCWGISWSPKMWACAPLWCDH